MANKKINIAELAIDDKALLKSTNDLAKLIKALREEQAKLKKEGLETSTQFQQNAVSLRTLSKAYNENLGALQKNVQATVDATNREEELNVALNVEAETIESLREQNKLLNKLRNQTNILTAEGREELKQLNDKLDENNEKIKGNVDAYTQQKINIGNYKDSIKEAFNELNIFNGGLGGFIARSNEAGGSGKLVTGAVQGMTKGMIGLTKSTLAFLATPVGIILGVIAGAFVLVKNAMNRSEEATNKITKALAPLTGLFQKILKGLQPVGDFLINVLVKSLEAVEKGLLSTMDAIATALDFLGFEETADNLRGFKQEIEETAEASRKLADAEAQLEENQRKTRLVQLQFQKDAEKFRQARDNETLSIADRIKANEQLGESLKKQSEVELSLAQQSLEVTRLRMEQYGETTELLNEQAEKLLEIADIQERITGQESEYLTNRNSLVKEGIDKQKEYAEEIKKKAEEQISVYERELEFFIESQGFKKKSTEEQVQFARDVAQKELDILEEKRKKDLIKEDEYQLEKLQIKNAMLEEISNAVIDNAQFELDEFLRVNQEQIGANQFMTEEILRLEEDRLSRIAEKRREFAKLMLDEGITTEREYQTQLDIINDEFTTARDEALKSREEQENEKKIIDLELRREGEQLTFDEDLQLQLDRLELQRQAEIKTAEQTGADVTAINKKYEKIQFDLKKANEMAKLDLLSSGFSQAKGLFKENTGAYKALALAEATINTYKGASLALSTYPQPIGGIFAALAIAQGLLQVSKIAGVKLEKGGMVEVGGNRHSQGGTKFYGEDGTTFEAEKGEGIGVLSRSAWKGFLDFNNSFSTGVQSRPGYFAGGGVITRTVKPQDNTQNVINGFNQAVKNMPRPVVTVEDIDRGFAQKTEVESGANS